MTGSPENSEGSGAGTRESGVDKVHLVLAAGSLGPVYVDSAWTTPEAAAERVADLNASMKAFNVNSRLNLHTLAIRLDIAPVLLEFRQFEPKNAPVVVEHPTPDSREADSEDGTDRRAEQKP